MSATAPLNLLHLAKAEPGTPKNALRRDLSVQALTEPLTLTPADLWLLLLEGELIVDLPHGDFRVLKVGDSVQLSAEHAVFTPLPSTVFLFSEGSGALRWGLISAKARLKPAPTGDVTSGVREHDTDHE